MQVGGLLASQPAREGREQCRDMQLRRQMISAKGDGYEKSRLTVSTKCSKQSWMVKAVFPTPPSPSTTNLYNTCLFPTMMESCCRTFADVQMSRKLEQHQGKLG